MTVNQKYVDELNTLYQECIIYIGKILVSVRTGRDIASRSVYSDSAVCFNIGKAINGYEYSSGLISDKILIKFREILGMMTFKYQDAFPSNIKLSNQNDLIIPEIYNDWYLPTVDALGLMDLYLYSNNIGNLLPYPTNTYVSSAERNATSCYAYQFGMTVNYGFVHVEKSSLCNVRPMRSFTENKENYSFGDRGPAGGWIFYVTTKICFEAAPYDLSKAQYSNIISEEIGATAQGTSKLDGLANSLAIVGQTGHVSSAAKNCLDLVI
jgi:hypothetical protein